MSNKLAERLDAFTHHAPSPQAIASIRDVRMRFMDFVEMLDAAMPESRHKSLAFTALEECGHWTMKAISHNDPEGKVISP